MPTMTDSEIDSNDNCKNKLDEFTPEEVGAEEEDGNDSGYVYDENERITDLPDLETSLKEVLYAVRVFFANKYDEALKVCGKWEKYSISHSLGVTFMRFLYALLTFEGPEIKLAKDQVKKTLGLVQQKRKQHSIVENLSSLIWFPKFDEYTDEQVHAELYYADCQIMYTLLTFFGDQSLLSLLKGAFRLRASNKGYKFAHEIWKHRTTWSSEQSKMDFESGVFLGLGLQNLILSHLPAKVLKFLALAGFHGDRDVADQMLRRVTTNLKDTNRFKVVEFIIVLYNLYVEQVFGLGESDITWAESLVEESLAKCPDEAFNLFFAGRLQQIKGNIDEAIVYFNKSLSVQDKWKQIHNICNWDLCWCYAIKNDWDSAAKYARTLRNESQWSPATNMYQVACFLYMKMEETGDKAMKAEIMQAMRTVPELQIRFAGKTLPAEKFAVTKARRYLEGDEDLTLPAFELFYIWNILGNCAGSPHLLAPIMKRVESKLQQLSQESVINWDGYGLCLLLKGLCLRYSGYQLQAIECFNEIIDNEQQIVRDSYIPPQASMELGLTLLEVNNYADGKKWLEKARDGYSGYVAETLVHLRVHGALTKVKKHESGKQSSKKQTKTNGSTKL